MSSQKSIVSAGDLFSIDDQVQRLKDGGVYGVHDDGVQLIVSYDEVPAGDGLEVSPSDAKAKPEVFIEPDENDDEDTFYCLILYDPDAPSSSHRFLGDVPHWVIWNCRSGDAGNGEVVLSYRGPSPPIGFHRYVFLICKQLRGFEEELPKPPPRLAARIPAYVAQHQLEVSGHTFFVARPGGVPDPKFVPELAGLRGAVGAYFLLTFFFDFFSSAPPPDSAFLDHFVHRGYIASAFIFVLSGFTLARSYGSRGVAAWENGTYQAFATEYCKGRLARIAPMYLVAFLSYLPFQLAVWDRAGAVWPEHANQATCTCLTILAVQAWSPTQSILCSSPLFWSVSVLVFFYATFPFLLVPVHRVFHKRPAFLALFVGVLGVAAELSIWYGVYSILTETISDLSEKSIFSPRVLPYGSPVVHWPEFVMGMAAGLLRVEPGAASRPARSRVINQPTPPPSEAPLDPENPGSLQGGFRGASRRGGGSCFGGGGGAAVVGVATDLMTVSIVCLLGLADDRTGDLPFVFDTTVDGPLPLGGFSFSLWYWLVLFLLPLWLVGVAARGGVTAWVLSMRGLVWVGSWSFCAHLIQWPVLTYLSWLVRGGDSAAVWDGWFGEARKAFPPWSLWLLFALVLLLAAVCHHFVEAPLRAATLRWLRPSTAASFRWLGPNATSDGSRCSLFTAQSVQ
ncbi:Protein MOTHER of FT and TFL1-like protein 2 [Diplonema papillatum]|nr:Protein MOTHER of FT and TFL1-like protein 2 [Diplonema papillatum]